LRFKRRRRSHHKAIGHAHDFRAFARRFLGAHGTNDRLPRLTRRVQDVAKLRFTSGR
jgi:hypothetical protein